jgi:signal transduction histidine kinase/ligand-binding sensor domain-containing protein
LGQPIAFLSLTKIETKDGLSSPNVRKIIQDKYGFMWFATQDGLNRYDGVRFTQFTSGSIDPERTILESDVYDMTVDEAGGYLWCLTAYGGLSKIDIQTNKVVGTFFLVTHPVTKNNLWFKCMYLRSGYLYIGTDEGFLLKVNSKDGKVVAIFDVNRFHRPGGHIDKVYVNEAGKVWMMYSKVGILVIDKELKNKLHFFSNTDLQIYGDDEYQFRDFSISGDQLFVCSSRGLIDVSLSGDSIVPHNHLSKSKTGSELLRGNLYSITANDGNIFITGNSKLYNTSTQLNDIRNIIFSKTYEDRNWLTVTGSVYQTGSVMWIGSQYGVGYIRNVNTPFSAYFNSMDGADIKIQHSITLCNANDSILVVCSDDGLYFSDHINGVIKKFDIPDIYYHAFKGPSDYIIASGLTRGLQVADKNGRHVILKNVFPEIMGIQKDALISSEMYDNSVYFMASQNQKGLYIWDTKEKRIDTINMRSRRVFLRSNIINRLFLDSQKLLWIVGDNTVSVYDHKRKRIEHLNLINPKTHKPISINMDVCESNGKYWIASYGTGVIELGPDKRVKKIYDANNGINNLGLYKIFPINDSLLIASSNNGLFSLNTNNGKVINYSEEDGLQSDNFEETSGCMSKDFIFFGGIRGYTKIEKRRFAIERSFPRIYYTSINVQLSSGVYNSSDLLVKELKIPSSAVEAVVNFSAFDYSGNRKLRFAYNIPELNDKWSLLEQRLIPLAGMQPGSYTLRVRAMNEYGDLSSPIELTLIFLPKWYQTWWFKSMIALLAMGLLYGLYRYRLAQIRKEQQIRQRIASDLHDDIGSTLNSIKVFANLSLMKPESNTAYLTQLKEGVQSAIVGVRDMVWVLDDKQDTFSHLVQRIEQFVAPLASAQGIEFQQSLDTVLSDHLLKKEEKRNLYLIIKEAFNNSIKYSEATSLQLLVKKTLYDNYSIVIRDNGKGFDTGTIKNGNGLNNLRYRATQIKYSIEIVSSPGNGTVITLHKS